MSRVLAAAMLSAGWAVLSCTGSQVPATEEAATMAPRTRYVEVALTSDLYTRLSDRERAMIPLLIDACREMDSIFWKQSYGEPVPLLSRIPDPELRRFAEVNYGPWDRLRGDEPFLPGVPPKPKGAAYYPIDMTREEFETACVESPERRAALTSPYTVVRRDASGRLVAVPFREAYREHVERAAAKLREAAAFAADRGLRRYLELRANALIADDYQASDLAWMDMKSNGVDVVIGPIENYEDQLFGHKTTHEGYVLIKDRAWSARLERYVRLLPELQRGLPVPEEYKREMPGTDSDLNAYDAVFYAGDCNAGSKTIAINLPNDEDVQRTKGTRRLQLKNAMRAKFDRILVPIADRLVAADQRRHVRFDAFFQNVMFHEVAHGLGIKTTIDGRGTVREALGELASAVEEGKADVLGLYLVARLVERGELEDANLMDNFVTYMAGIFRSVRFGATSAHGRANLAQFEFLERAGAFARDPTSGTYHVDPSKMETAVAALSEVILRLQGSGDREAVSRFLSGEGAMGPTLLADLEGLATAEIPTDVTFRQGMDVLVGSAAASK